MSLKPPLADSSFPRHREPGARDPGELRSWQEERKARRLKNEYESTVLHLSQLINTNLSTPFHIASVRVEGAPNTRPAFLKALVAPLVPTPSLYPLPQDNATLQSVLRATKAISQHLNETDIFQSVEAKIERSQSALARDGDVDIVFKTRERGRLFLNTSTEVGNGEGNATVTARIRNAFGGAELVEANLSLGTKIRRSYHALLSVPLTPTLTTRGELSIFGLERDNSSFASSNERLGGFRATIRKKPSGRETGMHEVTYEAVLRHVGGLSPAASISMREAAGQTIKSSLSHTWTRDNRDDKIAAARGLYTKLFQELAGLGGDAFFYKVEAEGQFSRRVCRGIAVSFATRSGLLWSLTGPSLFSDRFQLGGPVNMRSFRVNSMGPRDGADSLGGDLYWSAGLSLISDIPRKSHWPVKAHMFLNAGRLDCMDRSQTFKKNVVGCFSKPCISAGVGLIYRLDPIRVEVNMGIPLVANKSDGSRRGIQVGMGLEFL